MNRDVSFQLLLQGYACLPVATLPHRDGDRLLSLWSYLSLRIPQETTSLPFFDKEWSVINGCAKMFFV